ncbi:MAG: hypothetical protein IKE81_03185 [Clostridia bacterium]|nr:hypothetical protein [Clostridia bacterium]
MENSIVISVSRIVRPREVLLRRTMAVLAVVFLLQAIMFSTGFMLPCFLMTLCYFWFSYASKREYEYTLDENSLKIERVSDRGRRVLHEIPYSAVKLLCRPDAPEALPYKKGGSIPIRKADYTSYRDDVPYYTMIAEEDGKPLKLLLDLNEAAIRLIRRRNREAVKVSEFGNKWPEIPGQGGALTQA